MPNHPSRGFCAPPARATPIEDSAPRQGGAARAERAAALAWAGGRPDGVGARAAGSGGPGASWAARHGAVDLLQGPEKRNLLHGPPKEPDSPTWIGRQVIRSPAKNAPSLPPTRRSSPPTRQENKVSVSGAVLPNPGESAHHWPSTREESKVSLRGAVPGSLPPKRRSGPPTREENKVSFLDPPGLPVSMLGAG